MKTLLKNPSDDQEFDSATIFTNLSQRNKKATVEKVLEKIDSRQDGVLACADDLLEKAKYQANTKSSLSGKDKSSAQRIVLLEWEKLELEFTKIWHEY